VIEHGIQEWAAEGGFGEEDKHTSKGTLLIGGFVDKRTISIWVS